MQNNEVESVLSSHADHPRSDITTRSTGLFNRAGVTVIHTFAPSLCSNASFQVGR